MTKLQKQKFRIILILMEKKKKKYPSQIDSQISQVLIRQSLQGFNDGRFIIYAYEITQKKR